MGIVAIYDEQASDFSTLGLGVLTPISASVSWKVRGQYELTLEQPIDESGRWALIRCGRLVKVSVPVPAIPGVQDAPADEHDVYQIHTDGGRLILRSKASSSGTELGRYENGSEVFLLEKTTSRWYKVRTPDSKEGWMYASYLKFLRHGSGGSAPSEETLIYKVTTRGSRLRLRQKASDSSKILASYKNGTEVIVTETGSSWHRVLAPDGRQGFMYASYLTYVRRETGGSGKFVETELSRDQLFRIYSAETDTGSGTVTAKAMHITYDLAHNVINCACEPKAETPASVLATVTGNLLIEHPFEFHGNLSGAEGEVTGNWSYDNPIAALIGSDSGICAACECTLVRDNFDIYLAPHASKDTDILIMRGKNLAGVTAEYDSSAICTRILPEGTKKDGSPLHIDTLYLDSEHISDYPVIAAERRKYPVKIVDSGADNVETFKDTALAKERLTALAQADFDKGCDMPAYTLTIDFVSAGAYDELQAIHPYESVRIADTLIGLDVRAGMSEYVWDALALRYTSVTLTT